jgi:hypothetical protein
MRKHAASDTPPRTDTTPTPLIDLIKIRNAKGCMRTVKRLN